MVSVSALVLVAGAAVAGIAVAVLMWWMIARAA